MSPGLGLSRESRTLSSHQIRSRSRRSAGPRAETAIAVTTAFVLSGGASLGAVQVGMLQALAERDIAADLLVGASVGAFNAAFVAGEPDPQGLERLEKIWCGLHRSDVFPMSVTAIARAALHPLLHPLRQDHLVSDAPLRALITATLPYDLLQDAAIPLAVVATEVTTGFEVVLTRGPAVDALMASAAIPGIFSPVRIDGRFLMDGGVIDHTPISHAVDAGADVIYVLPTGYACDLVEPPGDALGMALQALDLLIERRLIRDVREYQDLVELHVLPPLCPLSVAPTDFSHAAELIERAHLASLQSLDASPTGRDASAVLGLHRHHDSTAANDE